MTTQITRVILKAIAFVMAFVGMFLFFGEEDDPSMGGFITSLLLHKSIAIMLFCAAYTLWNLNGIKSNAACK